MIPCPDGIIEYMNLCSRRGPLHHRRHEDKVRDTVLQRILEHLDKSTLEQHLIMLDSSSQQGIMRSTYGFLR